MTPDQTQQLTDDAEGYELAAARCLLKGDVWGAEYLLAYADEIHARIDRDQRRRAA